MKWDKSVEPRLNLSRSWHKGHSRAYNTPFSFKSSTKDLSLPIFEIAIWSRNCIGHTRLCRRHRPAKHDMILTSLTKLCVLMTHLGEIRYRRLSSMDSGLEAFSRNPTHGSFAALAFPPAAYANYVNQRFLSY